MVNLLSKKTSSFNVNPMFLWYSQLIYNANQLTGFNLKVKLILKLKTLEKLSFSLLHFETFFHWNTSANLTNRSSHRRYSIKNGVLKNFCKIRGKISVQEPFFKYSCEITPATLFKKGLWHWCFPANFDNFQKKLFTEHLQMINLSNFALWTKN